VETSQVAFWQIAATRRRAKKKKRFESWQQWWCFFFQSQVFTRMAWESGQGEA
jgi:hypothetical protein